MQKERERERDWLLLLLAPLSDKGMIGAREEEEEAEEEKTLFEIKEGVFFFGPICDILHKEKSQAGREKSTHTQRDTMWTNSMSLILI